MLNLRWICTVSDEWQLDEWGIIHEAFVDFVTTAEWTEEILHYSLCGSPKNNLLLKRLNIDQKINISARTWKINSDLCCIGLYDRCFNGYGGKFINEHAYAKGTIIHELAHVWDLTNELKLSHQMFKLTKSFYKKLPNTTRYTYHPAGNSKYDGATKCGHISHLDDFAESVAAAIYGSEYDDQQGQYVDLQRLNFVKKKMLEERQKRRKYKNV